MLPARDLCCMRGMGRAPWRAGRERARRVAALPLAGAAARGRRMPRARSRHARARREEARARLLLAGWLLRRPQGRQAALHAWIGASVIRRLPPHAGRAAAALQLLTG